VAWFRLAIGFTGAGFMVCAELTGGIILWEEGYREWIWKTDLMGAAMGISSLACFAFMPLLLMRFEKRQKSKEGSYHGHEVKSVGAAVPTITRAQRSDWAGEKGN